MSRLDPTARRWVERALGDKVNVESVTAMRGGVSSLIHEITFTTGSSDDRHRAILRRVEFRAEHPDEAEAEIANEVTMLSALQGRTKSPVLIAVDRDGSLCGLPATVQSRLPGRPVIAPRSLDWWIDGLVHATLAVHGTDVSAKVATTLGRFRPWWPDDPTPPPWTSSARTWSRVANRLVDQLPTSHSTGLVHRDLHPGNVLFHRRRWSGIVDWTHGCIGPVDVDVSRCRVQIAFLAGLDAADRYLDSCQDAVPTYDRDWDALVAIELSPWVEDIAEAYAEFGNPITEAAIQHTLDRFVQAADR
jgi:aminoglycoside phosphotransferase (APT) family kinase protein